MQETYHHCLAHSKRQRQRQCHVQVAGCYAVGRVQALGEVADWAIENHHELNGQTEHSHDAAAADQKVFEFGGGTDHQDDLCI